MNSESKPSDPLQGHVRLGSESVSAWVPREWEAEARAVLFAARINPKPFVRLPSFNTGALNPFFGLDPSSVRAIATAENAVAPWLREDVDVNATLCGVFDAVSGRAIPTLVLKLSQPMHHVALVAQIWALRQWTFKLQPAETYLHGSIESREGQVFGFKVSLPNQDSALVAQAMVEGDLAPGILALPRTYSFFETLTDGSTIPPDVRVLDESVWYGFARSRQVIPQEKMSIKPTVALTGIDLATALAA